MTDRLRTLGQAKAELLQRAGEAIGDAGLTPYLRRYFRHVAAEDLVGRAPEDLAAAPMAHRELAARRPQGRATVRVSPPEVAGLSIPPHTVVEIVCDDMPFLVDSVTAELSRTGRASTW